MACLSVSNVVDTIFSAVSDTLHTHSQRVPGSALWNASQERALETNASLREALMFLSLLIPKVFT